MGLRFLCLDLGFRDDSGLGHDIQIAFVKEVSHAVREANIVSEPWLNKTSEGLDAAYLVVKPGNIGFYLNYCARRQREPLVAFCSVSFPFLVDEVDDIGKALQELIADTAITDTANGNVDVGMVFHLKSKACDRMFVATIRAIR